jgi:hypothetical protein
VGQSKAPNLPPPSQKPPVPPAPPLPSGQPVKPPRVGPGDRLLRPSRVDLEARETLASLCSAYRDLQDQIAPLEAAKRELMSSITPLAQQLGIEKEVITPGCQLRRVTRTSTSILPERLLEKGVGLDVIHYATEERVTEYYQVDKVKL